MRRTTLISKTLAIVVFAAMLLTSCDVPDISQFTQSSAEMTRGIRTGVKDTETLIKTASERNDLYSAKTRGQLKKDLKRFQKSVVPTVNALDSLDGYLESLNALAEANKKSAENSKAVVNSVGGLVTAVSGFTFASEVVDVATGMLTLVEQFRTARSFKKRVNLAAEIVEGKLIEKKETYTINDEVKERTYFQKTCGPQANESILKLSNEIKDLINPVLSALNEDELAFLATLTAKDKRTKLHEWKKLSDAKLARIESAEKSIAGFGCGVIDFLKFNVSDLKEINLSVSKSFYDNLREKHETITGFHQGIVTRRMDIRRTQVRIQAIHNLITLLDEFVAVRSAAQLKSDEEKILEMKLRLKTELDDLFTLDTRIRASVFDAIQMCGPTDCGRMLDVLKLEAIPDCDDACQNQIKDYFRKIPTQQFNASTALIIDRLLTGSTKLDEDDKVLASRLNQLKPDYDAAVTELKSVRDKQEKLDSLLSTSVSALDAWAEAHANLRVAVNTNQQLTVAKLASKVREIWGILDGNADE